MASPGITLRALNRATLARQLLLDRHSVAPTEAIERLAGVQAQLARPPFVALWARLRGFDRASLLAAIRDREVVRATMMRGTLHLVSARDYRAWRPALAPGLKEAVRGLGARAAGIDVDAVAARARRLLGDGPRQFEAIRDALALDHPSLDARAMGYAVRTALPLVQVPSDGMLWGYDANPLFALADVWLGATRAAEPNATEATSTLVRRYLAAFGPASAADAAAWSGLRGLRDAFEALRPELVTFRDERKRELFDLPGAPRPDGEVDAPPRLLPEFDTLVLAHDDRTRVVPAAYKSAIVSKNLQVAATFLVDGFVAGTHKTARARGVATLTLRPFAALPKRARAALEAEALALVRFADPDARGHAVVFDESP